MKISADAGLLAVDIQNGFICQNDELPVARGREVIPVINRILPRFRVRVASQDWHPGNHGSFASNNPGRRPFDVGDLGGVPQVFWPDHCVQGTRGAEFHPEFNHRAVQAIFRKGTDPGIDSYSVFSDNAGRNPTGLHGYLASLGVKELFLAGLAQDYCVKFTAIDARRLMPGLQVIVILDAVRPVDPRSGELALEEMLGAGVRLIRSGELES
jgi:nicotinamidase/pyrazinamidase